MYAGYANDGRRRREGEYKAYQQIAGWQDRGWLDGGPSLFASRPILSRPADGTVIAEQDARTLKRLLPIDSTAEVLSLYYGHSPRALNMPYQDVNILLFGLGGVGKSRCAKKGLGFGQL